MHTQEKLGEMGNDADCAAACTTLHAGQHQAPDHEDPAQARFKLNSTVASG